MTSSQSRRICASQPKLSPWNRSLILVFVFVRLDTTQVVLVDVSRDVTSQAPTGVLVKSKVDFREDALVVDIIRDLLERGVVQGHAWHGGVRDRDGMDAGTVETPRDLGRAVAAARVILMD